MSIQKIAKRFEGFLKLAQSSRGDKDLPVKAETIAKLLENIDQSPIDENSSIEEYDYVKEMLWNLARNEGLADEVAQIMREKQKR